ncbi:hypothetical protein K435DRAFT_820976 [Dendrothele bispora CBS 962.96]|uniref:Uncharacterized protein n=1 Tax=Dendrothele bispora (strain CBS 962.96) TaxID=1314807 RepID=A0A4S8LNZ2_DENBC|nr:hypothetical protein K435DRAFT_820976 [Dendrothele bispora CBS 962.96]
MNFRPGGKQAIMCDGWYYKKDGNKVIQKMVDGNGIAKGMKKVLQERDMWRDGLLMECADKHIIKQCAIEDRKDCCCDHILDLQPDFQAQKSLVQETIKEAVHVCIFLPKFHCELNFIEFFWGASKKYLREHYVLASVSVLTIRKWEHRMVRWMEAYQSGLGIKEAQIRVCAFSSKRYKSHRRVPEALARQFDA